MGRPSSWVVWLPLFLAVGCEKSAPSSGGSSGQPGEPRARAWVKREFIEKASNEQLESVLVTCLRNAIGEDQEKEAEIVRSWTPGKRMLYTTSTLEAEVNNGGFDQYFGNTQGQFSQMALEGLQLLGAGRHADLLRRAIDIHKQEATLVSQAPKSDDTQAPGHAEENSALKRLDDEFFKLTENLSALRVKFIRNHLDEFATPS